MEKKNLTKLSHDLWKQKILYERASELAEKASFDEKYIFLLNEVLEEIKEINQKWFEEKIKK
ncbi:MAG: hypothetical protein ACRDCE_06130 [Cetobacterium sp.]|uniref:hypothetical protein n=1 Tax=Cetobacterium sp. TaxID=2071632 RepID=UPI003EE5BA9B